MQATTNDVIEAFGMVEDVRTTYTKLREQIDTSFGHVFEHAVRMAQAVHVEPSMLRITSLQKNRSNTPAETAQEYYRRNLAIPFVDHIIVQLESRFSCLSKQSASLLGLVPSVMCRKDIDITEAANLYDSDLPSPELLRSELFRWKQKFVSLQPDQRPSSCASALKQCDKDFFPNVHVLLRIACTLPCTSCECERSFSVMRRLRTYMRCSMSDDRLTSLALMHIHYDMKIDANDVVREFEKKHPRRIGFSNMLFTT